MAERKGKGAISSWADEVEKEEKEEEEEAKFQIQEKKKLNPFGSATRPRESVLQEREFNFTNLHHIESCKEKPLKENILVQTSQIFDRNLKKTQIRTSPKQALENSKIAFYYYKGSQERQKYGEDFVPPVKYPPKNLTPYLFPPIRVEPSDLKMGNFRSISIIDYEKRDNYFKGSRNQYKNELEYDIKTTNERRNTPGTRDSYYNH